MAQNIEDFLPPIQSAGLNTLENTSLGGTLAVTGAATFTGAVALNATTTTATGAFVALSGTSTGVSGGYLTPMISAGSTAQLGIYFGAGVPTISAYQGSIYSNVTADAGFNERLYVRTTTTWVGLQKASAS